jgi:hypothetical protein
MRTRNILATMVFSLFILIVGARFGLTEPKLGGGRRRRYPPVLD